MIVKKVKVNMNIQEIIKDYLKKNGYDGLYNKCACGCWIDDLMPCGYATPDCKPGYEGYDDEEDERIICSKSKTDKGETK